MAWVRIDDHLHSHPKIRCAWQAYPPAVGLHLVALSYAGDQLTDGAIDDAFVQQWLPGKRQRDRAIGALVDAALWEPNGTGWQIHDWSDYNQSREEVLERRRADKARKARGKGGG